MENQLSETHRETQDKRIELEQDAAQLAKRLSEFESRQQHWLEVQKQKQNEIPAAKKRLGQKQQQPAAEQRELDSARQQLEVERKEFDRFLRIDTTQRQVVANLGQLQRKKSYPYRLFQWLTRPFRRSE